MKRLIAILILVFSTSLLSQVDTTFSELRGMDDSSCTTHLFYRKYSYHEFYPYFVRHNDVYHLNLATQSDTLIFKDYFDNTFTSFGGITAEDFEFWQNDPAQFILCGEGIEVDPVAVIWRYDSGGVWQSLGEIFNLEISKQNDSLLYSQHSYMGQIKSTDGGYTWFTDSNAAPYFDLIALSPFDDQVFFSYKDNHLYKSINSGMNYTLVDSSIQWGGFGYSYLFFETDNFHVYAIVQGYSQSHFLRSLDAGDSWNLLRSSSNKIYLSVDPPQSGTVFLSDGSEIKGSGDYGSTFTPYWQLTRPIVGLYKKPNSDILYAATNKDIYEITPTDTVSIKHLSTIPVSINDGIQPVVQKFELYQNYPNPFNPTTTIGFDLYKASQVKIEVFNIAGHHLSTIFEGQKRAGYHTIDFDGSKFTSGIYFYRLTTENFTDVKKMVLMR